MQQIRPGLSLSVSEQFTSFNTLELDNSKIPNPNNEWMQSSVTQFVLGYRLNSRLALQINAPFIRRNFRRATDAGIETDKEEGMGDVTVAARLGFARAAYARGVLNWDVLIGLKLPTGDSDPLGEELHHAGDDRHGEEFAFGNHVASATGRANNEGHEISGIHGHDIALGTGSVDLVLGSTLFASWRRVFVNAGLQYVVRGTGDFDYQYADDLQFHFSPGMYLLLGHRYTFALQARLAGESKGKDHQAGVAQVDSQITSLGLGPNVLFTYLDRAQAQLGFELPVLQNTAGLQIVADYKVRAALTWRF